MRITTPRPPRRFPLRIYLALCLCLLTVTLGVSFSVGASKKATPAPVAVSKGVKAKSPSRAAAQVGPQSVGQWGGLIGLQDVPVHISLLPDGRVLYWGRDKDGSAQKWDRSGGCLTYLWNPADPTALPPPIPNNDTNLFCAAHSFLPDGRLLVTGGHNRHEPMPDIEAIGETEMNVFDYRTNTWTLLGPKMPRGRWYPSNVTMANGETAILSGKYWDGTTFVWHEESQRQVPRTDLNRYPEMYTKEGALRQFSLAGAQAPSIAMYPFLHLAPNGKVFVAGPGTNIKSAYFDPEANGGQGAIDQFASMIYPTVEGTSVLYDSVNGKVMNSGGSGSLTATSVIDLTNNPMWRVTAPMTYGRKFHTATILPNGKVLVTGGTQCAGSNNIGCPEGAATSPELWDPQTETWTVMAPNPTGIPRVYHSVALLLPDARVLVGGGGLPAAGGEKPDGPSGQPCADGLYPLFNSVKCRTFGHKDVEIFSPPYLFDSSGNPAPRPVINSTPPEVSYGQQFTLTFGNAASISKVTWVRLPSVSHGVSWDQRINVLSFATTGNPNQLNVTAPGDPRQCPPGHYMLFVFDAAGVPSQAKVVRISNDVPPPPTLTINDVTQAEGHTGTVNFNFTVSLSAPAPAGGVTFNIATADGTATAASGDYVARSLTAQTIPQGSSTYTFTVQANGDTLLESNETFFVNVTNVSGATVTDGQGQGAITNDDAAPTLTVNDVTQAEGNAGTTNFNFVVSLSSPAPAGGVSFNIATADGTASAALGDYFARGPIWVTIPEGSSTYTLAVRVNGDPVPEVHETFFVNVTNILGATAGDAQGQGTITNDEPGDRINVASSARGAVATASTTVNANYPAGATINGDRKGLGWGQGTGGWADGTQDTYSSDVAQVNFDGFKYVSEIDVYTLRDGYASKSYEPTWYERFDPTANKGQGITHFEVQYWNGSVWVTVPGGLVTDNDKVWRSFQFPEVLASAVRVQVHDAVKWLNIGNNYSRLVELEAWGRDYGSHNAVWVDDAVPAGATGGEGWSWGNANPVPVSGARRHRTVGGPGIQQHYFYDATETLSIGADDALYAYVYIFPSGSPRQVMLQWYDGSSWEHRAYWGENLIPWGTDGTESRRYMGPLPPTSQWVRLEVPASLVGLQGKTLTGMAFTIFDGSANWDYAGKMSPLPHTVWVDDALPAGAVPYADHENWKWVSSNPAPTTGAVSHQSKVVSGMHQHFFMGATATLPVYTGEKLFAYVYLDPAAPPHQVMLQWNEGGSWEHRAYWGENILPWGTNGTESRFRVGDLPTPGKWVRLEVPASLVGLQGKTVNGMAFTLFDGRATWDYAGKVAASPVSPVTPTNLARQPGVTTTQVSTLAGATAARAVDGNTDGDFTHGSVTHTDRQVQPWWEIDLGASKQINEVKVFNRTDCCPERLTPFYLLVSDVPFTSKDLNTTRNQPGVSSYYVTGLIQSSRMITVGRPGRYLRVQLEGDNFLSLAEVEVWSDYTRKNLARQPGATATASSQINANFPISAVVDGDRTGRNWGLGGFASGWNDSTQGEYSQDWLQVTFDGVKTIHEIDVFTLQDNFDGPAEPTLTMMFSTVDNVGQGITDYELQYKDTNTGKWVTIPKTHVTGNNRVWRQFIFTPVSTNEIRVVVHGSVKWTSIPNNYSRIVEVEAY